MKFLRGKVWQIVLAVCLLVVLLCITASAAEPLSATVTFGIDATSHVFTEDPTTWVYLKTSADGTMTEGTENDYNIALVVEDDLPVMLLNGATIKHTGTAVEISTTTSQFVIKTEGSASTITQSTYESVDDSERAAIRFAKKLVFCGTAKLTVTGANSAIMATASGSEVLFNGAVVDVITTNGRWGSAAFARSKSGSGGIKTIDVVGGKVFAQAKTYMLMYCGATTVNVDEGGHLTLQSDSSYINWNKGTYNVNNGYLYAKGKVSPSKDSKTGAITRGYLFASGSTIKILEGGTFEAQNMSTTTVTDDAGTSYVGEIFGTEPTWQKNSQYAVLGASKAEAIEYTGGAGSERYFKVGKKTTVSVTDGTAQAYKTSDAVINVIAGDAVTVTAFKEMRFDGWVVTDAPEGFALSNTAQSPATFTMPDSDVSLKANLTYATDVILRDTTYTITDVPAYYTIDENGDIVSATEADYKIKLAYDTTVRIPTVYLNLQGTTLSYGTSVIKWDSKNTLAVVTESSGTLYQMDDIVAGSGADDTPSNDKCGAVTTSGKVIFRGDYPLVLKGNASGIYGNNTTTAELVFEGIDVDVIKANATGKSGGWYDNTLGGSFKGITVNGGQVDLSTTRFIMLSNTKITVNGGAKVTSTGNSFTYGSFSLDILDGYVYATGSNSGDLLKGATITIAENGVLEVVNTNAAGKVTSITPKLFEGYYAVWGTAKSNAEAYDVANNGALTKAYFKAGKRATITVENGTAKGPYAAAAGETATVIAGDAVTLTATVPAVKKFAGWTINEAPDGFSFDTTQQTITITAPKGDVSLTGNTKTEAAVLLRGEEFLITDVEKYYTTNDSGEIVAADKDSYKIKLVYNTDGIPTIYLKNANLTYTESVIEWQSTTETLAIETEGASTLYQTKADKSGDGAEGRDEYGAVKTAGKVEFYGDALLTLKANASAIYGTNSTTAEIVFKGSNVSVQKLNNEGHNSWQDNAFGCAFKQITFYGGTATVSATRIWSTVGTTVFVDGGAKVSIIAPNITLYGGPQFTVVDGYLYAKGTSTSALFHQARGIKVEEKGIFEAENVGPILDTKAPVLAEGLYAVMGDSKASAEDYVSGSNLTGKYFKVGKSATVSVVNGKAKNPYAAPAAETITAIVGDTITLVHVDDKNSSDWLANWAFDEGSSTPTIANNTFTMPNGAVSITATYKFHRIMKIMGIAYNITEDDAVYFTTSGGTATRIDAPQDGTSYNIKLALVDSVPTVYLKGAEIVSTNGVTPLSNGTNVTHFVVVTEDESSIACNNNAIYLNRCDLTFKGSEKLSILGNTDNSAEAYAGGGSISVYHYNEKNDPAESVAVRTITFGQNANVYIWSGGTATAGIWSECHYLEEGKETSGNIDAKVVFVGGSTLEVESNSNIFYSGVNLTTSGYENWAAVCGETKQTATGYDGTSLLRTQKYFKLAPGYEVNVTGGTATGASSNNGRFLPGTVITLAPETAATGKAFWQWATADDIAIASNKFTMIDSDVSVDAEWQNKASIYLKAGRLYNILEKTPTYWKIVPDAGATAATEADYELKLAYTKDGKPAVYLKGAHMLSTTNDYCLTNGPDMDHLLVIVEEDSSMTTAGRGIHLNNADLTIRGPGKLTINSNTGGKSQHGNQSGILVKDGFGSNITFASDADVEIYTHSEVIGQDEEGKDVLAFVACIWIENGSQPVTIENGAKVQLSSPSRVSYRGCTLTIDAEYTDRVAIYGDDLATAPLLTSTSISDKRFFKIAPGYDVTVTNGTANIGRALEGMKVTVTAGAAGDGEGFKDWTATGITLSNSQKYAESITFTMPGNAVTFTPVYGDLVKVYLKTNAAVSAVRGGATKYYITNNGSVIANGATADNYNVMFTFPEEGAPILRLNNVSGAYGIFNFDIGISSTKVGEGESAVDFDPQTHLTAEQVVSELIVEVEGTNYLNIDTADGSVCFVGKTLTMRSVDGGTVTARASYRCFKVAKLPGETEKAKLILDDVNLKLDLYGRYQGAFELYNTDIDVIGGKLEIVATAENDTGIKSAAGGCVFRVSDDAIVEINMTGENNYCTTAGVNVILDAYVDADGNPAYSAVASTSKEAFMADPEGSVYNAGESLASKQYFRVDPREVKVQITWGAMSFTYDGATWNVDTMTWDGDWTPVDGETETEAGNMKANQINVENVGTETVNVSFEFRPESTFTYATVTGAFVDGNDAAIEGAYKLVRTAEIDAFLDLNSAAVATDFGQDVKLGVIVVTIDALTPSQGSEA